MQNKIEIINKEKKELQENIKKTTSQRDSINSEHRRSVDIIKKYKKSKKYEDNLKTMKEIEELEEDLENAYKQLIFLLKINMILKILIYMIITKMLVINMILTILIERAVI